MHWLTNYHIPPPPNLDRRIFCEGRPTDDESWLLIYGVGTRDAQRDIRDFVWMFYQTSEKYYKMYTTVYVDLTHLFSFLSCHLVWNPVKFWVCMEENITGTTGRAKTWKRNVNYFVRFDVLMVVTMISTNVWDVTPCNLRDLLTFRRNVLSSSGLKSKLLSAWLFGLLFDHEDEAKWCLRNGIEFPPDCTVSYPRRLYSSDILLSEATVFLIIKFVNIRYFAFHLFNWYKSTYVT
jgi:hypothetical protein